MILSSNLEPGGDCLTNSVCGGESLDDPPSEPKESKDSSSWLSSWLRLSTLMGCSGIHLCPMGIFLA